jgi:hypothetical protein
MAKNKPNKPNKQKSINKSSKIQPISEDVGSYQESLALYQKHPSLPTFLYLLEKSLSSGVRLQSLKLELSRLADIDDDQFFGEYGSKYFSRNKRDLEVVYSYRNSKADILTTCAQIWKIIEIVKSDEIYAVEKYLVGASEALRIKEASDKVDPTSLDFAGSIESVLERSPYLQQMLQEVFKSSSELEMALADVNKNGIPMVPWAAWISHYLPSRDSLSQGLQDLSEYLGSYFLETSEVEYLSVVNFIETIKIDVENAGELAKIAAFLIFGRLFKRIVYNNAAFSIDSFFSERINHLSVREIFLDPKDQAEYIVGISNLLLISAKLGVSAVEEEIVSKTELQREYLLDVETSNYDLACLCPIPSSGFAQIIKSLNPHEGDRPESINIYKALQVASYGMLRQWDDDLFDEMFDMAFRGLDPEVELFLRLYIKRAAKGWLFPLQNTYNLQFIYEKFWSDELVLQKISNSLFAADLNGLDKCKLPMNDVMQASMSEDFFEDCYHPILFARKFSHIYRFVEFTEAEWIDFCNSLINAGQVRHACSVAALNITIIGVNNYFNIELQQALNLPRMMRLLTTLSNYDSFDMVRQAIADLFEMSAQIPPVYKGSLKEYLPHTRGSVVSLKSKIEDEIEARKKQLLQAGFFVTRLSSDARENLLKGYSLSRNKESATFGRTGDAVRNYLLAIEGELRSRVPGIDAALADELKYLGVDIKWAPLMVGDGRRAIFSGLGSISRLLEAFTKLSPKAKEKLGGLQSLSLHPELRLFQESMREVIRIRNVVQHADSKESSSDQYLERMETLMFGENALIRILCDTR